MKKLTPFYAVAILCAITAACNPFGLSPEEKIIQACESALEDRLKAPTTYERLKTTKITSNIATLEQYMGWDTPEIAAREKNEIERNPKRKKLHAQRVELFKVGKNYIYESFIQYVSHNSFGTPIRGTARCSLTSIYEDIAKATENGVERLSTKVSVNGFSKLGWSVEMLIRAKTRRR